jgi:hypothetical protein
MQRLGYTRYVAQGGDVGAAVTDAMAIQAPNGLAGIHLNFLRRPPLEVAALLGGTPVPQGLTEKEQAAFAAFRAQFMKGYIAEQGQSPQTIGYALTDSPVGLAAWMLDHDADCYLKIARTFVQNSTKVTPWGAANSATLGLTSTCPGPARAAMRAARLTVRPK